MEYTSGNEEHSTLHMPTVKHLHMYTAHLGEWLDDPALEGCYRHEQTQGLPQGPPYCCGRPNILQIQPAQAQNQGDMNGILVNVSE